MLKTSTFSETALLAAKMFPSTTLPWAITTRKKSKTSMGEEEMGEFPVVHGRTRPEPANVTRPVGAPVKESSCAANISRFRSIFFSGRHQDRPVDNIHLGTGISDGRRMVQSSQPRPRWLLVSSNSA